MISYKSFCWALGTTSFRTTEFNKKVEKQLKLIKLFWNLDENKHQSWSANNALQERYYDFLQKNEFVDGSARNKAKDAREKTSGLADIGLVTDDRKLTPVGSKLLELSENANFKKDNILQIDNDSFLFFKQLLKTTNNVEGNIVNPYLVIAGLLQKFKKLSREEFTYLAPLIVDEDSFEEISKKIIDCRNNQDCIDDIIFERLMSMDNYIEALQYFLDNQVTEEVILTIGMNRKSSANGLFKYDKPYFLLYSSIREYQRTKSNKDVNKIFDVVCSISGKASGLWKSCLFTKTRKSIVEKDGISCLSNAKILSINNEEEFKKEFFRLMHLFKAKATLADYYDLNKRYFKTTDTIIFEDNEVKLDVIPQCFFNLVGENIFDLMFKESSTLTEDCSLKAISKFYDISKEQLYGEVETNYNIKISSEEDVKNLIQSERYERFNHLIEQKFTNEKLIDLLSMFETRKDNEIKQFVTNNADIPTIFEYVVAIAWYKISDKQGDVLSYMNLSLDADLLPKSHAQGGQEDITYLYSQTEDYPAHSLLIEVTLSEGNNQRRMEMEPVSRHLVNYKNNVDISSYALFVANELNKLVLSDFRGRKLYYYEVNKEIRQGLKIIPLSIKDLSIILQKNYDYQYLYKIFDLAYNDAMHNDIEWYDKCIKEVL